MCVDNAVQQSKWPHFRLDASFLLLSSGLRTRKNLREAELRLSIVFTQPRGLDNLDTNNDTTVPQRLEIIV